MTRNVTLTILSMLVVASQVLGQLKLPPETERVISVALDLVKMGLTGVAFGFNPDGTSAKTAYMPTKE